MSLDIASIHIWDCQADSVMAGHHYIVNLERTWRKIAFWPILNRFHSLPPPFSRKPPVTKKIILSTESSWNSQQVFIDRLDPPTCLKQVFNPCHWATYRRQYYSLEFVFIYSKSSWFIVLRPLSTSFPVRPYSIHRFMAATWWFPSSELLGAYAARIN